MTMKLVQKRGKDYFVIDTRPSKKMRAAKKRTQKRMLEIQDHLGRKNEERD
jgi:hypothetical protein